MFNASITQNNFLGSGKRLVFAFNNSQVTQLYRLSYDNPYYTVDGISRGFDISYQTTDFDQLVGASYTTDVGVLGMNFGLPITDTSRAGLGLRYQNTKFNAGTDSLAQAFVLENGTDFNDFILTASYTSDTRDTAIFPTDGNLNTLLAEVAVPGSDLTYYRLTYRGRAYVPLTRSFTFAARGDIGYGDGYGDLKTLPFFENFFAGGPNSVRGWEASRLGPVETGPNYAPVGGNLKITGSLELFAPPPVDGEMAKTIRLGVFFDFGNVWETHETALVAPTGFNASDIRYSTGVSVAWLSPVGALSLSLAYPLNEKEGDQTQAFQFTFGQTF
jgi:outer membrane protein insertion porin family